MESVSAFIKGWTEHHPNACITFDKFHVVMPVSTAGGQDAPHRAAHRQVPQYPTACPSRLESLAAT